MRSMYEGRTIAELRAMIAAAEKALADEQAKTAAAEGRGMSQITNEQIAALREMAATVAIKGPLLLQVLDRLAAAEAREARLVAVLKDLLHVCNHANFDNGVVADNGANEGDYLAGRVMDRAKAALTNDGSALAQAIERVLDAPGLRLNDAPDLHGVALVNEIARLMGDLEARIAALRAAWRGA